MFNNLELWNNYYSVRVQQDDVHCTAGLSIRGIHSRPKEGQTKGPVLRELGRMDQTVGELFGRSLVFFLTHSQ